MYVHRPINVSGKWVVIVSETVSPISKVIEKVECSGRKNAWQTYLRIRNDTSTRYTS